MMGWVTYRYDMIFSGSISICGKYINLMDKKMHRGWRDGLSKKNNSERTVTPWTNHMHLPSLGTAFFCLLFVPLQQILFSSPISASQPHRWLPPLIAGKRTKWMNLRPLSPCNINISDKFGARRAQNSGWLDSPPCFKARYPHFGRWETGRYIRERTVTAQKTPRGPRYCHCRSSEQWHLYGYFLPATRRYSKGEKREVSDIDYEEKSSGSKRQHVY